jgi:hypothetical protein
VSETTGRSRVLRIEVQIDIPPGREVRRDQLSAATEAGVRVPCDQLATRARAAGEVSWRRGFYYAANKHGEDEGTFTTLVD